VPRRWIVLGYQLVAAIIAAFATRAIHTGIGLRWVWAYLLAINVVAFAFFGFDKAFVGVLGRLRIRVPERVLIWGLAFPGGMIGAWAAMHVFRHKTSADKRAFRLQMRRAVILQALGVVCFWFLSQAGVVSLTTVDRAIEVLVDLVYAFFSWIFGLLHNLLTWVF